METRTTSSTYTGETANGTHLFHILKYSGLQDTYVVGEPVRSGTFNVGGYEWAILFYPNGEDKDYQDHVSVYLEQKTGTATKLSVIMDLSLVDQATGTSCPVYHGRTNLRDDTDVDDDDDDDDDDVSSYSSIGGLKFEPGSGLAKFKKKSELVEGSPFVKDDRLTIECALSVQKEPVVTRTVSLPDTDVSPSDIPEQLGMLLEDTEAVDVDFRVQGVDFAAHKLVLAMRSPVFKAQLYGPMRDRRTRPTITVEDMQPKVFKALLHFIYTGSLSYEMDTCNCKEEFLWNLLVAADRYGMVRLKTICERELSGSLDVETVATMLEPAERLHCRFLKHACIEFIASPMNMDRVVASHGYKQLKASSPALLVDVWEKLSHVRIS